MEVAIVIPKRPRGRPRKIPLVPDTEKIVTALSTNADIAVTPEGRILVPRRPDTEFFSTLPPGFTVPRRADYLGDVLIRTQEYQTDAQKVIWLRHNASMALTYLLRLAFCKDVEWLIPPGCLSISHGKENGIRHHLNSNGNFVGCIFFSVAVMMR